MSSARARWLLAFVLLAIAVDGVAQTPVTTESRRTVPVAGDRVRPTIPTLSPFKGMNLESVPWYYIETDLPAPPPLPSPEEPTVEQVGTLTRGPYSGVTADGVCWLYTDFSVPRIDDRLTAIRAGDPRKRPGQPGQGGPEGFAERFSETPGSEEGEGFGEKEEASGLSAQAPITDEQRALVTTLWSSVLNLGDADGAETVYLNGTLIGQRLHESALPHGSPRRYILPGEVIRFGGRNRLAIRFETKNSSRIAGIPENVPLTLSHLDWHDALAKLDDASALIGRAYGVLYRANRQGLMPEADFQLLNTRQQDLQTTVEMGYGLYRMRDTRIILLLEDVKNIGADLEQRRATLEFKTLARRELSRRKTLQDSSIELKAMGIDIAKLAARPDTIGRFGLLEEDGLPAVRSVTPVTATPYGREGFAVRLDGIERADAISVGWDHKTSRVSGMHDPNIISPEARTVEDRGVVYYQHESSLYPGLFIDVVRGKTLVLEFDADPKDIAMFQFAVPGPDFAQAVVAKFSMRGATDPDRPDELEVRKRLAGQPQFTLVVPRRAGACPVMIVNETAYGSNLRPLPSGRDGKALLVLETSAPRLGKMAFLFPLGANRVDASPQPDETSTGFLQRLFGKSHDRLLAAFFRFGARFPMQVEEWYAVDRTSRRVTLVQHLSTYDLVPELKDTFFPSVPPPLVHLLSKAGYPAKIESPWEPKLRVPGLEGPLMLGQAKNPWLVYSLPLPDWGRRAMPYVSGDDPALTMLRNVARSFADDSEMSLADRYHRGREAAFRAWSLLTPELRSKLLSEEATLRAEILNPANWQEEVEPHTGRVLASLGFTEGPTFARFDQDFASALTLLALDAGVAYTGDMTGLDGASPKAIEIPLKTLTTTDDWAWSRGANTLQGFGTGSGDVSNLVLAAYGATARLYDRLDKRAQSDQALYFYARAALPVAAWPLLTEYGQRNNLVAGDSVAIGFIEGVGFLPAELQGYPWNAVSPLAAHGVAEAAWEVRSLWPNSPWAAYLGNLESSWPELYNGAARYEDTTAYDGNSGYLTVPLLYAHVRTGASSDELDRRLTSAATNNANWWTAPPLLAELGVGRHGVWVVDWGKYRLLGAALERPGSDQRLRIELAPTANSGTAPSTIVFHAKTPPKRAILQGQTMPIADGPEPNLYAIEVPPLSEAASLVMDWSLDTPKPPAAMILQFNDVPAGEAIPSPIVGNEFAPPDALFTPTPPDPAAESIGPIVIDGGAPSSSASEFDQESNEVQP